MRFDSSLSIKDSSGRQISLLNEPLITEKPAPAKSGVQRTTAAGRRRYHCTEPGCNKSFTTSGHLARHNRIHTGEKNFHCLYPGCPSRFSRQDNMMQHYRTHMSPRSRRNQQLQHSASRLQSPVRIYSDHHNPLQQQTRPRRSMTYPPASVEPYPPMIRPNFVTPYYSPPAPIVLPKPLPLEPSTSTVVRNRASSVSSTSSSASASSSPSSYSPLPTPPPTSTILPPPHTLLRPSNDTKSSGLLQLANIVSTFG